MLKHGIVHNLPISFPLLLYNVRLTVIFPKGNIFHSLAFNSILSSDCSILSHRTDKTRWMEAFKPPVAEQEGETVYADWGKCTCYHQSSNDFSQ